MPFTLAHPAAVLPLYRLARGRTSLSALIIGSIAPDLVYFLPTGVTGRFSHSIQGIFLFCVPAGLLIYTVFHALMKAPLTALLPARISNRIDNASSEWIPKTGAALLVLICSLAAGAFTHIAWDAFTHGNTPVVRNVALLREMLGPSGGPGITVYRLLQHVSTACGLVVMARYLADWLERVPEAGIERIPLKRFWRNAILGTFIFSGALGGLISVARATPRSIEGVLFHVVVGSMAGTTASVLVFCAIWRFCSHRMLEGGQRVL